MSGSHNDIIVVQPSPIFDDSAAGRTITINFMVNDHEYNMGYYIRDKIDPEWVTIVKAKSYHANAKDQTFATAQGQLGRVLSEHLVF
jgi:hypothetical protein